MDDFPTQWKPTHRLHLAVHGLPAQVVPVMVLPCDPGQPYGPAYTAEDWRADDQAEWAYTPGGWERLGVTPLDGLSGTFRAERIS